VELTVVKSVNVSTNAVNYK